MGELLERWGTTGNLAVQRIEAIAAREARQLHTTEEETIHFIREEDELRDSICQAQSASEKSLFTDRLESLIENQPEAYQEALTMRRLAVKELVELQQIDIPHQPRY